ncbi:uL15 family ribosomal protein [Candidatus Woesearchaeota archaeon]|nr:uL15 family ribosomal protein [Candidatus Woesearchaeota archaeon]
MTINKRKKNVRMRGSKTHGWGAKKKHRGSGNRGGKGRAGSGKRADSKKPTVSKQIDYFGKHGFISKARNEIKAVNISYLEDNMQALISQNLIKKENGYLEVDLQTLGFDKLLSKGRATNKYKIKVAHASEKAIEKIKKKEGEVLLG